MSFSVDHQQYRLNTSGPYWNGHGSGRDGSVPGRWDAVRRVMEAEGLIDRWCYRKYLWPILERYQATPASNCREIVETEHILQFKNGMLRGVLEQLNRPMDPTLGVLLVGGGARLADVRATAMEVEMSMGAGGLSLEQFPVPGFRNAVIVRLIDFATAASQWYHRDFNGLTSNGKPYWYDATLYLDLEIGLASVPAAELAAKLDRGPLPELVGRPLNREPRSIAPTGPTAVEVQLAELTRKLKVAELQVELAKLEAQLEGQPLP